VLTGARGAWLTDARGHELAGRLCGLWCMNVRAAADSVVQAATAQLRQRPTPPATSAPQRAAIRLAAKRRDHARLAERAYLTLGGSEAVDRRGALHRAVLERAPAAEQKHFIALEPPYHGSSSTGAGLTAAARLPRGFDCPLATQHHIPSPTPTVIRTGGDAQR